MVAGRMGGGGGGFESFPMIFNMPCPFGFKFGTIVNICPFSFVA